MAVVGLHGCTASTSGHGTNLEVKNSFDVAVVGALTIEVLVVARVNTVARGFLMFSVWKSLERRRPVDSGRNIVGEISELVRFIFKPCDWNPLVNALRAEPAERMLFPLPSPRTA